MTQWDAFAIAILIQVTAITLVAAVLLRLLQRSAAQRHAVALVSLLLVLLSPALVVVLPQSHWLRLMNGSGIELSEAGQGADLSPAENLRRSEIGIVTEPLVIQSAADSPGTSAAEGSLASKSTHEPAESLSVNTGLADSAGASGEPSRFDDNDLVSAGTPQTSSTLLSPHWSQRALRVVLWGWGVGMLIPVIRLWRARRALQLLLESLEPVSLDERLQSIGDYVLQHTGLSRLPVISSSTALPTPAVLGLWHPIIVLPAELLRDGSDQQLRDVLIHECAHVVRRDPWILALQKLAGILWWLHPGVIWLNRQLQRAREEVCDNYVLSQTESTDYAQTLLHLTERCTGYRPALSLLGLFAQRWTLEARVTGLLDPERKPARRTGRASIIAIAVVFGLMCFALGGVAEVDRLSGDPEPAAAEDGAGSVKSSNDAEVEESVRSRLITIRGTCRDEGSQPLSGVTVRVYRYMLPDARPALAAETTTDDSGRFEFTDFGTAADRTRFHTMLNVIVAATADGFSSAYKHPRDDVAAGNVALRLASKPVKLTGTVNDHWGRPLKGATVSRSRGFGKAVPGIFVDVTDEHGRFEITDLPRPDAFRSNKPWAESTQASSSSRRSVWIAHPDFATSRMIFDARQEVVLTLEPPAIIQGSVVDLVTGHLVENVLVTAQGVARGGWFQTRSDSNGRYRLRTTSDHYNIWADMSGRVPIAVKAIQARADETTSSADIRMTRGGFITGRVIDFETGQPMTPAQAAETRVAHYGPARPRTGAAVATTHVNPDGTYRLHVAAGRNYVYLISGGTSSAWVTVGDGQEVEHDINTGDRVPGSQVSDDPDERTARRLRSEAQNTDRQAALESRVAAAAQEALAKGHPKVAVPFGSVTPTGVMLERLKALKDQSIRHGEPWARTLRDIIRGGGASSVPDLIKELDATDDPLMFGCLAFALRAIGDKRAVPALIRAVPRVMWAGNYGMGLICHDDELTAFLQKHDLDDEDEINRWSIGGASLEVLKTLQILTGQDYHRDELFHIIPGGFPDQDAAREKLFHRAAKQWSDWWEMHWSEFVNDPQYSRVNLPDLVPREPTYPISMTLPLSYAHHKTHNTLESIHDPIAWCPFYDLDTGRSAHLPERWKNKSLTEDDMRWILKWAASEGFDLVGDEYVSPGGRRTLALRMIGLNAWEFDEERWEEHSKGTTLQKLQGEGRRTEGWLLHFDDLEGNFDPAATASFLFITREGTPGVLHVSAGNERQADRAVEGESESGRTQPREGRHFSIDRLAPAK